MYVALYSKEQHAVYRMAIPYQGLDSYAMTLLPVAAISFAVALLIAIILSRKSARSVTRPLREIAREEGVCKIAVYDELGPENNAMRALPQALPGLRVIQSGGNWLDISVPDANKGNAMRFLRDRFALSREECAAFGDHMNDYEMLLECGHPYVTGNAYPPLKRRIGNAVRSNAENGVVRALQHIADGLLPNGRSMNENTSA